MHLLRVFVALIAPLVVVAEVGHAHAHVHDHLLVRGAHPEPTIVNGRGYTVPSSAVKSSSPSPASSAKVSSGTVSPVTGTAKLPYSLSSAIFHPAAARPTPLGLPSTGANRLPQSGTNGQSNLGTFNAPQLPKWLNVSGYLPNPLPFNNGNPVPRSPPPTMPKNGVTRSYNFVISRQTIAPDGVERPVILVNDAFPGPTIEANWGDTIQVTVTNNIQGPVEGASLHWHGLLQTGTPYMDGVPGIDQCPIAPGTTLTYTFLADLYGTSWWHAHYSAQYAAGMFGAMIIHGPTNAAYDVDLGPVLLTDYYHDDYYTILERVMGTDLSQIAPYSQNNLINGKGEYDCSLVPAGVTCTPNAGYSKFEFQTGKTHRLRLINAGGEGIQKFSIDNHVLQVIAVDFVPIVPYYTNIVTLGIGQRTDVLVTANLSSNSTVWMRSTLSTCSLAQQPNGLAMVYYPFANQTAVPTSTAYVDNTNPCANDPLASEVPYFPQTPTSTPQVTTEIDVNFEINSTGNFLWIMNNSSFRVDYNAPILNAAVQGNDSYPYDPEWNVYNMGKNTSMRFVVENLTPVAHPMHLHGHNMYVLSEGTGTWDGSITNPSNPTRRDVQLMQPGGYMVMQFDADNPGVWPFHCHIAWHVSGGLYVNILERPDLIPSEIKIPANVLNTCNTWAAYTASQEPDQIDSGLKMRML